MTLICLREEIVGLSQDAKMFAFCLVRCFPSFAFHWNFVSIILLSESFPVSIRTKYITFANIVVAAELVMFCGSKRRCLNIHEQSE